QTFELFGFASTEHHIICNERALHLGHDSLDFLLPNLASDALQSGLANAIFDRTVRQIGQLPELERENGTVPNKSGAEASAESNKKHATTGVTAEGLHRRVVNEAHWFFECLFEIESGPTFTKVFGIG